MNTTSVEITAGLGGFLVLFALALAVWFLGRDLTKRLRRMNRAEEMRQQADVADDVVADDVAAGAPAAGARADAQPAQGAPADDVAVGEAPAEGELGEEPGDPASPRTEA